VVDPSLLRQAADRGVTICFADLDGADGLWVPEERTVLVNRGLPEDRVAEVIRHELGHVAIDDQHAELDAGHEVLAGLPPSRARSWAAALGAAALVAAVGGLTVGLTRGPGAGDRRVVEPPPDRPATSSPATGRPTVTTSPSLGPDGRIVYVTITVTRPPPRSPSQASPPAGSQTPSATARPTRPSRTAPAPPTGGSAPESSLPPVATTPPSPTPPPTQAPTSTGVPEPTTPPAATGAGQPGDTAQDATGAPTVGATGRARDRGPAAGAIS